MRGGSHSNREASQAPSAAKEQGPDATPPAISSLVKGAVGAYQPWGGHGSERAARNGRARGRKGHWKLDSDAVPPSQPQYQGRLGHPRLGVHLDHVFLAFLRGPSDLF